MDADTLRWILNIGTPILIGVMGGYFKTYLRVIESKILKAIDEKYMHPDALELRFKMLEDKYDRLETRVETLSQFHQ